MTQEKGLSKSECRLPVRQLVEFVLKGGSIDNRFGGGADRLLEGARIHRKLQKEGGETYQAEVPLCLTTEREGILFTVEGRADGVITGESGVMIDEIKTTGAPMDLVTEDFNRVHWAQAQCYGYFICVQQELEAVEIRLTYYQVDSGEIKRFQRAFTREELRLFYEELLDLYLDWARWQAQWKELRDTTIQAMPFPFSSYREGQRELAVAAYRTIAAGTKLYCQAPTGIGKTLSTLFPSAKAMGEQKAEKIFYLTAKTITRKAAEGALALMRSKGLRMKSVTLTAKDKICFLEERTCNPEQCEYADGHFDRVNGAVMRLLECEDHFSREAIEECARKERVCPFELSLDLTLWSDCILCDYNYLFDPTASLKRFFSDQPGEYIFLVDEAHNLVDRAREMYSAGIKKSELLTVKKIAKGEKKLCRYLNKVNGEMIALRKICEEGFLVRQEAFSDFNAKLRELSACCDEWLTKAPESPLREQLLILYFEVLNYLKIADLYDERYVTCVESAGSEVEIRQLCLDPSLLLKKAMSKGRASVLFSATLTPLDYFRSILGGDSEDKTYGLPSPYSSSRLCLMVADWISTRYQHREGSVQPICDLIHSVIQEKTGNYLVYFPSYQYLRQVYEEFTRQHPAIKTLVQQSGMGEEEREAFLEHFDHAGLETLVGFCVLGGVFSEGIDLKGERLVGTVVVGVGLPQINRRQDIVREYFDRENHMGFEYAYRYPGMNKVMQAAGRVIRGEEDRGVVLLIDDRFDTMSYRGLFPPHWSHARFLHDKRSVEATVQQFWALGGK